MKRMLAMCCIALSVLLLTYSPANAQLGGFGIYGGLALPTGDFGSTSAQKAGYALSGFTGGLEITVAFPIDLPIGIGWITSVSGTYNDIDIKKMISGTTLPGLKYDYTPWYAAWGLTGGALSLSISPISFYGFLQIGVVGAKMPELTYNFTGGKAETTADLLFKAPAFCIGAGAGLGPLRATLRYMDAGELEFDETTKISQTYAPNISQKNKVKVPMSLVMLTAGLEF